MKKFIITIVALLAFSFEANAQIVSNGTVTANITGENPFFDGSTNFDTSVDPTNSGKGLVFPRTDLTSFTFKTDLLDGILFPTAFDGMIVYNSVAGNTPATGSGIGNQTLGVGYYYFSNPGANTDITNGRWLPLGGNPKVNVANTETVTNTLVNNAQVYAIKGTFTANGTSTAVNIPSPTGMTGMYSITIYKAGTGVVYDKSLYSYTLGTGAGNAITGSPSMSVVYPNGVYDYVLEYLK